MKRWSWTPNIGNIFEFVSKFLRRVWTQLTQIGEVQQLYKSLKKKKW